MKPLIRIFVVTLIFSATLPFAAAQDTREISKTVSLKADGRLIIDTYKGSVTISAWDKTEVEVNARIEADDSWSSKYAEEDVRDTEVRISGSDSEVRIKSDYDRLKKHHDGFWGFFDGGTSMPFVHYTIKMPRTAQLKIKDYKSKTRITDLRSDLELNTYKGDVDVSNLDGSINLETYKGDVEIAFSKFGGQSRFETYKGNITISLPKKSGFELDSDFGRRTDFNSDFDVTPRYRGRKHREADYHGSVNGGGPRLHLKSEKGSFRLRQS